MKNKFTNIGGDDTVSKYFKEIRKTELLTIEEEVELANRIQKGDKRAMDKLVEANLKFVISIAKEYQGQGILLGDLINEGNYGLIKAAKRFDATRGFRFISYAVYWIRQSIIQCLNDNSRMIRLPVNVLGKLNTMRKQMDKFEFENERLPVNNEDLSDNEEEDLFNEVLYPSCSSFNTLINDDGDELIEFISDESAKDNLLELSNDKLSEALDKLLEVLDNRERAIIECYFGLNSEYEKLTLEDIGLELDLTKERVRQIKEKAVEKLKYHSSKLRKFINK